MAHVFFLWWKLSSAPCAARAGHQVRPLGGDAVRDLQHWNWRYKSTQTGAEGGSALTAESWRVRPAIQHLFTRKGKDSTSLEYWLIFSDCKSNFWCEMHPWLRVWPPPPLALAKQKIHYPTKLGKAAVVPPGWDTVRSNRGFLALCSQSIGNMELPCSSSITIISVFSTCELHISSMPSSHIH